MWKFVVLFLCVFAMIFCINGSSLSLSSPSNPNPSPRESENVEEFQFEEKMEELENFHAEFKDFKSSLVELSAAFRRFHQSVAAVVNGSSTKPEPEPDTNNTSIIPPPTAAPPTIIYYLYTITQNHTHNHTHFPIHENPTTPTTTTTTTSLIPLSTTATPTQEPLDKQGKSPYFQFSINSLVCSFHPGKNCYVDPAFMTSCSVAMETLPSPRSKKQSIYPFGNANNKVEVLCDFETDGGGWTVIQKRSSGPKHDFDRTWSHYFKGFGSLDKNFWLGLENIHALTKNGDQELRIELEDFEGNKRHANYSSFFVSDASKFYRLSLRNYSGDAGDDMTPATMWGHNGMRFTTKDKDNDKISGANCAVGLGGWWFNWCGSAKLNGLYFEKGETVPDGQGIHWNTWNSHYSLAKTEMKIRKRK